MDLTKFVPKNIKYTATDLYKGEKNSIKIDLNKNQFPQKNMI